MSQSYALFAGIDWAKEEHTVCILDREQKVLDRRTIAHSGEGLSKLVEVLEKLSAGKPDTVAVAIETPRGAVVEFLVERRFPVFSLNPKQMDRFRDRHSVAGAKDDRRDAFVLADALRTDMPLFHKVRLDDPNVIRIRELGRTEEDVRHEQVRCCHRLRDLLNRYYPQMLALCPAVDEPWFWDLLELIPMPESKFSAAKVKKILDAHRIRKHDASSIKQALEVPPLPMAPGAAEAASEHALLLLPLLRLLHSQLKDLAGRSQQLLDSMSDQGQCAEHRDVTILLSLPGVGRVVTATMLAEASQPLAERDYHALRAYCGIAPVTRQSGKKRVVLMRQSCNGRLRNALYHWARVSAQHDNASKEHYAALRAKGHSHGRALRGLADRLLAVLIAMLRSGKPFDPDLRGKSKAQPDAPGELAANADPPGN